MQDEDITCNATDAVCCISLFKTSKYLFFRFFNTVTVNNIQHTVLLLIKLSTVSIPSFICAEDLIHQTLCDLDSVQRKMIQAEKTGRIHSLMRNLNQTSLNQVNLNLQRKILELCQAHSLQLAQQVHRPLTRQQQHHQLPRHKISQTVLLWIWHLKEGVIMIMSR